MLSVDSKILNAVDESLGLVALTSFIIAAKVASSASKNVTKTREFPISAFAATRTRKRSNAL